MPFICSSLSSLWPYTLCVCVWLINFSVPLTLSCLFSRQEFNTSGSSNTDSGKASGSLETKYKMKELGLSFSQKWNTDNTLATEVTVEDQVRVSPSLNTMWIFFKADTNTKVCFSYSWLRDWRWPWTRLLYQTQGEITSSFESVALLPPAFKTNGSMFVPTWL